MRKIVALTALALAASCAPAVSTGGGSSGNGASGPSTSTPAQSAPRVWPVITRIHVDLWLHGYAMLMRDTSTLPVFRRGYRDRVQQAKNQRTITTRLDANRTKLQERLSINPGL